MEFKIATVFILAIACVLKSRQVKESCKKMVLSEMRLREDLYASRRKSESEFLQKMLTASLKIWITMREMPHLVK